MLRDFLKEKNKARSKRQPFYDRYDFFQTEIFNLLQRAKRPDTPIEPPSLSD